MQLFFKQLGQGKPLIIIHGLLGSSSNWSSVSQKMSEQCAVYTIDLRNHGNSPHDEVFNYAVLTDDVYELINKENINKPVLLGHSLGGKIAMQAALRSPDQVAGLIVVDIMPKSYPIWHQSIIEHLCKLDLSLITSRQEAFEALASGIPSERERLFLLKNLIRTPSGHYEWQANLSAIRNNLSYIYEKVSSPHQYQGPVLFITGKKSIYKQPGDEVLVRHYFPKAQFEVLDTGHWVHAEKPVELVTLVTYFMKNKRL